MAAPQPACRYADLAARVALLLTGTPVPVMTPACEIRATHRVRVEGQELGLAFWLIAEVCVMCSHMARDLPGFSGQPWPIDQPGVPIIPSSPLPDLFERALQRGLGT